MPIKQVIFSKQQLETLKEGSAYVQPSSGNSTSANIANDISSAQRQNPNDSTFVLNSTEYDGNGSSSAPTLNVKAKDPQDAQHQIEALKTNPRTKNVMDKGAAINVDLEENTIKYTKAELNKILFS